MPETKPKSGVGSLVVRPLLAGMVAAGAVAPVAAPAAEDIFLQIRGIKGDATDSKHKDEIVLLSYSQSFTNPVSSGGSAGKANCGDIKVTKLIDQSSPDLIGGVLSGKNYPSAVITFRSAGNTQTEYYTVTLTNVVLDAITQSDTTGGSTIVEMVSMSAARFKFEYRAQNADWQRRCAAEVRLGLRGEQEVLT